MLRGKQKMTLGAEVELTELNKLIKKEIRKDSKLYENETGAPDTWGKLVYKKSKERDL